jgi:hypothetical protein
MYWNVRLGVTLLQRTRAGSHPLAEQVEEDEPAEEERFVPAIPTTYQFPLTFEQPYFLLLLRLPENILFTRLGLTETQKQSSRVFYSGGLRCYASSSTRRGTDGHFDVFIFAIIFFIMGIASITQLLLPLLLAII